MQVLSLLLIFVASIDQAEYVVRHRKPSDLLKQVRQMELPDGIEVLADDLKGVIRIKGSEREILHLRQMMVFFDIAPRQVVNRFTLTSPADRLSYQGMIELPNNNEFTFFDATSKVKISLMSRVRDDDKLTTFVTFEIDGGIFKASNTAKEGVKFVAKAVEAKPMNKRAEAMLAYKATILWPELSVTSMIKRDDEGPKR